MEERERRKGSEVGDVSWERGRGVEGVRVVVVIGLTGVENDRKEKLVSEQRGMGEGERERGRDDDDAPGYQKGRSQPDRSLLERRV